MSEEEVTVLFRPVGPKEMELIRELGYKGFPPRLPEQPIFYPVLNEEYATQISRKWNVPSKGLSYVTRFYVQNSFLRRYKVQIAGARMHQEYWIPAEDLDEFNSNIVGLIEVVAEHRASDEPKQV